jgi:hypothetical protein
MTPGTGCAGIGSRWLRRRALVRRTHSTPPPRRTVCRLEAAEPLQWMSLACLVIGLLGPGLLKRHPGRVFPSQQPDQTAVGGGHRRRRQVVVDHVMGQLLDRDVGAEGTGPWPHHLLDGLILALLELASPEEAEHDPLLVRDHAGIPSEGSDSFTDLADRLV